MKKKLTISIAITILLSGCNGSSDKLAILDLDSAIKNDEITNIEISSNINATYEDGVIRESKTDLVIFPRSESQYNQEIQIYSVDNNYSKILLNSKIVRYFRNNKLK